MKTIFDKLITLVIVQTINSMSIQKSFLMDNSKPENDIVEIMNSKGYLPSDKNLPKLSTIKDTTDEASYILSKLTDEELIRLLNVDSSKNTYDLNEIVQIALEGKTDIDKKKHKTSEVNQKYSDDVERIKNINSKNFQLPAIINTQTAFHKLNHKEIDDKKQKNDASYLALKKLHNLIHTRNRKHPEDESLSDEKKELLFNFLVAQLKALCCKNSVKKQSSLINNQHSISSNIPEKMPLKSLDQLQLDSRDRKQNEFIFLILNDEIKSKDNGDLIQVDPDTLERNSSVLILGPVTSSLSDDQLKILMNNISNELSKPEYTSLLQQLSDGTTNDSNINVMKNLIYGPETRRYIKAHRCNHQSKLSKIYGGPKWLICTGYLNINTPSLYD